MRQITVCPGLGDQIWVLQKLINAGGERFSIRIPSSTPLRGKQLTDMLPALGEGVYTTPMKYSEIKRLNISDTKKYWRAIHKQEFVLSANLWLESGGNLKDWLPDLDISYTLPYVTSDEDKKIAKELLPAIRKDTVSKIIIETKKDNKGKPYELKKAVSDIVETPVKYIGIYTSAYGTQRNWEQYGAWNSAKWMELIKLLYKPGIAFVVIGAEWDEGLSNELMDLMHKEDIPFVNTIGQPLTVVLEIQRILSYGFYFPSGLPIMNVTGGGSDCVMFYGTNLTKMINTYADPALIKSGRFKECLFCEPKIIFDWVAGEYKLFEKLGL